MGVTSQTLKQKKSDGPIYKENCENCDCPALLSFECHITRYRPLVGDCCFSLQCKRLEAADSSETLPLPYYNFD
jgi:hypothetical protein